MIAVTGATGQLGQLAIDALIRRGVSPKEIVAVVRSRTKAKDLESKGVQIREGNYDDLISLEKAFAGIEKLLFVSGSEVGKRVAQHQNVVNALKRAGVDLVAYTSIVNADRSRMMLAKEHLATEQIIKASGVKHIFLRNAWYFENHLGNVKSTLEHGVLLGATKDQKLSAAARADYADAGAKVLVDSVELNRPYELSGAQYKLSELAAEITKAANKTVQYKDVSASEYAQFLLSVGLPGPVAEMLADSDEGIARGDLRTDRKDLEVLLGRKPQSLAEAVQSALK